MKSVIPIEDKTLAELGRIISAWEQSVQDAFDEDGGIDGWKKFGFDSQVKTIINRFVKAVWDVGWAEAGRLLDWGHDPQGHKPLTGFREILTKEEHRISLTGQHVPMFYEKAAPTYALPAIALAQVAPAEGLAWYQSYNLKLVGVAQQELLDKTKGVISRGAELGLAPRDIKAEISQTFDSFSRARLSMIVRSESSLIYNTSSLTRYAQDPMVTGYRYLVVVDDRTTEICLGFADMIVDARDLRDVPPLHFNCRSVLEPLFVWETFQPSDMAGVEPMKGFGSIFPTGTGIPGLPRLPLPAAVFKPPLPALTPEEEI